jgi:hypothetical protein
MNETLNGREYKLPDDVKVLVGTPNYTNVFASEVHANHIHLSVEWTKWGLEFNHMIIGRTFVHFARSQMCDMAIKGKWSHLLWLDDDAVIDEHALPAMLERDLDVVIAPYPMRRPPYEIGILRSTAYSCLTCKWYGFIVFSYAEDKVVFLDRLNPINTDEHGPVGCPPNDDEVVCPKCESTDLWRDFHNHKSYKNVSLFHNISKGGLMEVDGGGTHCMLVKTGVFHHKGELAGPNVMPPEVQKIVERMRDSLSPQEVDNYNHYLGDLPDETQTFKQEDADGKPYFLMPKRGTEDMYWCYRARRKGLKIYMDCDLFASHVGFPQLITKGFRERIENQGFHKTRDRQFGGASTGVDIIDQKGDGTLPLRQDGVHQDKASSLI